MLAAMMLIAAAQVASPQAAPSRDIVVKARPLASYKSDLDACIARQCPPKEEIAASLSYAEAQLLSGDYAGSRSTLLKARGRNARFAAELPIDVSDLHHANARLADLNGRPETGRVGMFDVVGALKAGLPDDDARVMAARLMVGDAFAKDGRFYAAMSHYRWVEKLSRKANMPLVVGMAKFRRAALLATVATVATGMRPEARRAADEILRSPDPNWAAFRNGMRLVPAYLAPERERPALLEAAVASLEPQGSDEVQLVYHLPIDLTAVAEGASSGEQKTQWADVAFRIGADGRVTDVEVLRQSERLAEWWLAPALKSLRARRYAPLRLSPGSPGITRLERYSLISDQVASKETRIAVRASKQRVDIIDLSGPAPTG